LTIHITIIIFAAVSTVTAKAEQRRRTHESILASAARLLRAGGIPGARIAEVMRGAGLTVGGFYAHFASKEALIDAALRRTAGEVRAQLLAQARGLPATEGVEAMMNRYLSQEHRDEPEHGCPLPAVVGEIATRAPAHAPVVAEQLDALVRSMQQLMPAAPRPQARQLAVALAALMYGGLALARATRGTALSDEILRACRGLGSFAARSGVASAPPAASKKGSGS
jgi:TetR/AcrR family transcriptional regulator, transcriptional repressor for nem operon